MIDVVVAGAGLAGCLVALVLRQARPELSVRLVEREPEPGGEHTWSFHGGDLTPEQHAAVRPLVSRAWSGYTVRFPSLARRIEGGYASITSRGLRRVARETLGGDLLTGRGADAVAPDEVTLADGTRLHARCVLDARGLQEPPARPLGYQKFLGLTLRLASDCPIEEPLLMDATVPQRDGFRFVYALPFSAREVLVEDTCYSDGPGLDRERLRQGVRSWASDAGWRVEAVLAEETGVLPIPLDGRAEDFWPEGDAGVARLGMRAGLFHATTGYSLPEAVRAAQALARLPELTTAAAARLLHGRARAVWRRGRFLRLLNRMLFRAAEPPRRFRVLEHFYRLPAGLIERFYADRLTAWDRLRILSGRPPVPVLRAARSALWVSAA